MSRAIRRNARIAAAIGVCLLSGSLAAQTPSDRPSAQAIAPGIPRPPELPSPPPPEPPTRSPVDFFRELLAMNGDERQHALADRSETSRKQILAKVREYQSLEPDKRELRLQATELHWFLLPLLSSPATNRAPQLVGIPIRVRKLVEDRMREWDKLSPEVQKALLANVATIQYFTEIQDRSDNQRRLLVQQLSPERRKKLQEGIDQWNQLSESQRRRIANHFNQFFSLTSGEQEKALRTLSVPERRQLERTLQTFGGLPSEQRTQCIRSFEKFASMSLADRNQFLKNAERWKLMTPGERQAWRDLVSKLPPPEPPEMPPLPPGRPPVTQSRPAVATNGN